ncbi:hypothetical protein KORDIASMS9_04476 [Kordia sp. SMS9]|nr:hypothetical protein KORDIASMS9_04476 [Kordia sp. SMS9]
MYPPDIFSPFSEEIDFLFNLSDVRFFFFISLYFRINNETNLIQELGEYKLYV